MCVCVSVCTFRKPIEEGPSNICGVVSEDTSVTDSWSRDTPRPTPLKIDSVRPGGDIPGQENKL